MALDQPQDVTPAGPRRFRLDRERKKVFGVCAGLAAYFDLDPVMVRIAWVAATILGVGALIPIYLAIWLIAD